MDDQKNLPSGSTIINDPEGEELLFDRNFKPKGAVAFFALLVMLGMIIWFGIYYLMLSRV
jgi:Cytochrome c oxidase subunit IIa family